MTLETLFTAHGHILLYAMLASPWVAYLICWIIPGKREEPWVLGANLWLSVGSMLVLAGYIFYLSDNGGWRTLVKQADVMLLLIPPYHFFTSLWLSRLRLPLKDIPTIRILQGLGILGGIYVVLSWLASKVYIVFFSYMPFYVFLVFFGLMIAAGYWAYRRFILGEAKAV